MQLELLNRRISSGIESTLGTMFDLEGPRFLCYVLEDQYNVPKVPGETRIPPGRYEIRLRAEGGLTKKYADRFPDIHKGMLWLQDVPGFSWIYIHCGNDDDDTEGCLIVGDTQRQNLTHRGEVSGSVSAYRRLYQLVVKRLQDGFKVYITIEDYA